MIVNTSELNVSVSEINNDRLSVASADNMMNGSWWISRVNVQGVDKGTGVGSKLLQKLVDEILFYGPTKILVAPGGYHGDTVKQFNFYRKNGFVDGDEEGLLVYQEKISLSDKIKEKANSVWDKTKQIGVAFKRETSETYIASKILRDIIKGKEVSPEQIKFLKEQSADIGKALALIGLQAIPGSSVAIIAIEKVGQKHGFTLFPQDQTDPKETL